MSYILPLYRDPKGYFPFRSVASAILADKRFLAAPTPMPDTLSLDEFNELPDHSRDGVAPWVVHTGMLSQHWPAYWVSPDLFSACEQTDPPPDVRLPREGLLFMLPLDRAKQHIGGLLGVSDGSQYSEVFGYTAAYGVVRRGNVWVFFSVYDMGQMWMRNYVDLNLYTSVRFASDLPHGTPTWGIGGHKIIRTVLNLVAVMNARPQLIESREPIRTVTLRGEKRKLYQPAFFGRAYRLLKERGTGTHATPRLHCRRGHFRNQPCGNARSERKTIWIEPTWVGGVADA